MGEMPDPSTPAAGQPLDSVAQRVIGAIAKTQRLDPASIGLDDSFDQLGFDSLDGLNIVFAVEEEFNVSVPDEAAQTFTSVRQVVDALRPLVESSEA